MVAIRWLGHAAFELVTCKGKYPYLGPWLNDGPTSPVKTQDVVKADVLCVSQGHNDHIRDAVEIAKKTGAKLICPPEIGFYADSKGLRYDEASYPLNVGGSVAIDNVTISMTFATHFTELYGEEWVKENRILPGAGSVGYVVETEDGVRIYFVGDTGLFGDMRFIGEIYNPDVALLPIGGKYNMGPKLASIAAKWIRPKVVIPMHYNTYPAIEQDPKVFDNYLRDAVPGVKLEVLRPGETLEYSPS